ncbi:MAG: hypothetical protein ACH346_02510 [Chthoniobacterales bacterium]
MNDPFSQPYRNRSQQQSLELREFQAERKFFIAEIRENERGKYLRITEETQGRRNTILVPNSAFADFAGMINEILSTEAATAEQQS